MSAGYAKETGLAFAVGFVNATTSRASTRGIARIYEKNMNAMQFSLISNLRPKVSECPRPQFIPLILDWYHRVGPCGNSDLGINGLLCAYDQATGQPADQSANAGASADGNASTLAGACADECQCPGRVKRGLPCRADCPKRVGS